MLLTDEHDEEAEAAAGGCSAAAADAAASATAQEIPQVRRQDAQVTNPQTRRVTLDTLANLAP